MSFNVQNVAGTPFIILCIAAIAKVPVETPGARIAFWIGFVLCFGIFWFLYAPAAAGDPGGAFCCGFVVLAGPAAYGLFTETGRAFLGPVGVALTPWVAMSAGPIVSVLGTKFSEAKDASQISAARTEIAGVGAVADLIPYLIDEGSEVRDIAAKRLLDLAPGPKERSDVLTFCVQTLADGDWKHWHDGATRRVFDVCRSLGPIPRADLLELYATQAGAARRELSKRVERELLAADWGDDRDPLIESARRRAGQHGGDVDAVVIRLLGEDRDAAKSLAELALEHMNLQGKTALVFGPDEGHALLVAALDDESRPIPVDFVDAALALPPASGLALLARILRREENLEHHIGRLLDEVPLLFAGASEAPEAAQDLLEAIEALRAGTAESSWAHGLWTRAAEALRKAIAD